MSLKTKSIKKPRMPDDGLRISVMSRHRRLVAEMCCEMDALLEFLIE